jgi:hypothetical protein
MTLAKNVSQLYKYLYRVSHFNPIGIVLKAFLLLALVRNVNI